MNGAIWKLLVDDKAVDATCAALIDGRGEIHFNDNQVTTVAWVEMFCEWLRSVTEITLKTNVLSEYSGETVEKQLSIVKKNDALSKRRITPSLQKENDGSSKNGLFGQNPVDPISERSADHRLRKFDSLMVNRHFQNIYRRPEAHSVSSSSLKRENEGKAKKVLFVEKREHSSNENNPICLPSTNALANLDSIDPSMTHSLDNLGRIYATGLCHRRFPSLGQELAFLLQLLIIDLNNNELDTPKNESQLSAKQALYFVQQVLHLSSPYILKCFDRRLLQSFLDTLRVHERLPAGFLMDVNKTLNDYNIIYAQNPTPPPVFPLVQKSVLLDKNGKAVQKDRIQQSLFYNRQKARDLFFSVMRTGFSRADYANDPKLFNSKFLSQIRDMLNEINEENLEWLAELFCDELISTCTRAHTIEPLSGIDPALAKLAHPDKLRKLQERLSSNQSSDILSFDAFEDIYVELLRVADHRTLSASVCSSLMIRIDETIFEVVQHGIKNSGLFQFQRALHVMTKILMYNLLGFKWTLVNSSLNYLLVSGHAFMLRLVLNAWLGKYMPLIIPTLMEYLHILNRAQFKFDLCSTFRLLLRLLYLVHQELYSSKEEFTWHTNPDLFCVSQAMELIFSQWFPEKLEVENVTELMQQISICIQFAELPYTKPSSGTKYPSLQAESIPLCFSIEIVDVICPWIKDSLTILQAYQIRHKQYQMGKGKPVKRVTPVAGAPVETMSRQSLERSLLVRQFFHDHPNLTHIVGFVTQNVVSSVIEEHFHEYRVEHYLNDLQIPLGDEMRELTNGGLKKIKQSLAEGEFKFVNLITDIITPIAVDRLQVSLKLILPQSTSKQAMQVINMDAMEKVKMFMRQQIARPVNLAIIKLESELSRLSAALEKKKMTNCMNFVLHKRGSINFIEEELLNVDFWKTTKAPLSEHFPATLFTLIQKNKENYKDVVDSMVNQVNACGLTVDEILVPCLPSPSDICDSMKILAYFIYKTIFQRLSTPDKIDAMMVRDIVSYLHNIELTDVSYLIAMKQYTKTWEELIFHIEEWFSRYPETIDDQRHYHLDGSRVKVSEMLFPRSCRFIKYLRAQLDCSLQ